MGVRIREQSVLIFFLNESVKKRTNVPAMLHHKCVSKIISVLEVLRHEGVNKRTKFLIVIPHTVVKKGTNIFRSDSP